MGGKKRLNLKQMERTQTSRGKEAKKKKEKIGSHTLRKKATVSVIPPNPKNAKTITEVQKMKVLTPYTVACRFNIRISTAKDFLEQLQTNGLVELVSNSRNLKIYKPVAS